MQVEEPTGISANCDRRKHGGGEQRLGLGAPATGRLVGTTNKRGGAFLGGQLVEHIGGLVHRAALVAGCRRYLINGFATLVTARELFNRFQAMIRQRKSADLRSWLQDAASSLLASFATGLQADDKAVAAAIVEPWSNGQTEGQITKLKLVKRQMYGRAKLDLLRAPLLGTA